MKERERLKQTRDLDAVLLELISEPAEQEADFVFFDPWIVAAKRINAQEELKESFLHPSKIRKERKMMYKDLRKAYRNNRERICVTLKEVYTSVGPCRTLRTVSQSINSILHPGVHRKD